MLEEIFRKKRLDKVNYSGKTLKEISSNMGISYAYVKVLQNKAFEKMKRYFEN